MVGAGHADFVLYETIAAVDGWCAMRRSALAGSALTASAVRNSVAMLGLPPLDEAVRIPSTYPAEFPRHRRCAPGRIAAGHRADLVRL